MAASLRFYRDLLRFEIVESSGGGDECGWCWIRLGSVNVMLNTAYEPQDRPPAADPVRIRSHEDTTLYFGSHPAANTSGSTTLR